MYLRYLQVTRFLIEKYQTIGKGVLLLPYWYIELHEYNGEYN
tara:strand:- start:733 stop:858 length:126 start_codon:yes stop_codon:yes gene_type:complete